MAEPVPEPGADQRFGPFRVLDKKSMIAHSRDILAGLDVNVPNVRATVRRMSGGQRQSIAIARAANWARPW